MTKALRLSSAGESGRARSLLRRRASRYLSSSVVVVALLLCALFLVGPALGEQGAHRLTLEQAFERALAANLGLASARTGVDLSETRKRLLRSFLLPRLTASGEYVFYDQEAAFGRGEDRVVLLPTEDWTYRLLLRQPLYAGGRDLRAYRQAALGVDAAQVELRDAENLVLLATGLDYLGVLEGEALVEVEERNVELATKRLGQATDFYEAGEVTRVDVLRAEASIKAAERRLAEARQQRAAATGRLRIDLALDGPIEVERPGVFLPAVPDENALLDEALSRSPEVREAELALEVARLEVKKQKGARHPLLFADAGWTEQKSSFPSDSFGFVGLNLSLPLFKGGEIRARVDEANENRRLAEFRLEDLKRNVTEDVRVARLGLETAETVLALAREELEAVELEYQQMFELYSAQEATALDLEASELSLARAHRTVVTSEVGVATATLAVYDLVGILKEVALGHEAEQENP